jgi:hypothetical protein
MTEEEVSLDWLSFVEYRGITQVLEKIGAGEGNRTLVISLEGGRKPSPCIARYDNSREKPALRSLSFSVLSQRRNVAVHPCPRVQPSPTMPKRTRRRGRAMNKRDHMKTADDKSSGKPSAIFTEGHARRNPIERGETEAGRFGHWPRKRRVGWRDVQTRQFCHSSRIPVALQSRYRK